MSGTSANIVLNHLQPAVKLAVSHSASPEIILPLIAAFQKLPVEQQTSKALGQMYKDLFGPHVGRTVSILRDGCRSNPCWEYEICEGSKLSVRCHQFWVNESNDANYNPFEYAKVVQHELRDEYRDLIARAVLDLKAKGVTMQVKCKPAPMPPAF